MSLRDDAEHLWIIARGGRHSHDAAQRLLAALEHAEVMWRVRYSDGDASEPYEDFSQAEWLSAANAEDGMSNTLERVLVIREEAE